VASLAESVSNWLGRVELLARGAEDDRREAVRALERGDALEARRHARELLSKAPGSPLGLALLAESCEKAFLYDEATEALRQLCTTAPWRGELWVSLGEMLERVGAPIEEVSRAYQSALDPDSPAWVRREALLKLADLDLASGDPWRASRWLDALRMFSGERDIALRRLEVAVALGDRDSATIALDDLGEPDALDGRSTLACARGRWMLGEPGVLDMLVRAYILDAMGADQALASYVSTSRDAVEVTRVRELWTADQRLSEPAFALALAHAEGRAQDAQDILESIARAGDRGAAASLYDIAVERGDGDALIAAVEALGDGAPSEGKAIAAALRARAAGNNLDAVALLDGPVLARPHLVDLADRIRTAAYASWMEEEGNRDLQPLMAELRRLALRLDRLDLAAACEALAIEMQRPLRVAVVGEFNAGKSTFINALIGADVAPTGILPTTASLHWLSWAPDAFARIVTAEGPDRIVGHDVLKAALGELQAHGTKVRLVHICAPIERLRRIEVLDTPGFNAPETDHVEAARRAFHEAHVALWLMDASQAMKDSERRVIAEIRELGTPVLVLVNKCDRLTDEQVARVVGNVREGLAEAGLSTIAPAVGFSARLALAGRLGHDESRVASRWDQVEELLSEHVVNRSDSLRRDAVRRKAWRIASQLEEIVGERRKQGADSASSPADETKALPRLESLDRTALERIASRMAPVVEKIAADLQPLKVAGVGLSDAYAHAYAEARFVARMTGPMSDELAAEAKLEAGHMDAVRAAVAPTLRGAASTLRDATSVADVVGARLVRACAIAALERLREGAKARVEPAAEAVLRARIGSLRRALGSG
jgi:GTP-binding protein EngB required for normal cell division